MITHYVLFKVKESVSEEAIGNAFNMLFKIEKQMPGIIRIIGSRCRFHEGKGEGHFTHGFSIDFKDDDSYKDFFENPITEPAKGCIVNITEDGMDGIFGFDMGEFAEIANSGNRKYRIQAPRLRLVPPGSMY